MKNKEVFKREIKVLKKVRILLSMTEGEGSLMHFILVKVELFISEDEDLVYNILIFMNPF